MSKLLKIGIYAPFIPIVLAIMILHACKSQGPAPLTISDTSHISLIGNNLGSRMINYDNFETELYLRYPEYKLHIRNMCDGGETPGFRPHAGRNSPWAFPGAEKFHPELASQVQTIEGPSEGRFETPDQWLTRHKTDVIIAFFGYNESFEGKEGLDSNKAELDAFIKWTLKQKYNDASAPQLAIVSPIAFEKPFR
ncbi:hypothetical protein QFZ48_000549 [Chitinophaga sp. W2I13]|uniref:hypothetical protein n=1 Tax=Chitinophaga sp. W2I13 TaxID=3373923 RepID=UPI003D1EEAA0